MGNGLSVTISRRPIPWRRYTGRLNRPLTPSDDISVEVDKRLADLYDYYGIDQADPSSERKLVLSLAHHHVPGFRLKPNRRGTVDNAFIIETIEGLREHLQQLHGRSLSDESVIAEMLDRRNESSSFGRLSEVRALSIYSHRREHLSRVARDTERAIEALRRLVAQTLHLDQASPENPIRILRDIIRRRYS